MERFSEATRKAIQVRAVHGECSKEVGVEVSLVGTKEDKPI